MVRNRTVYQILSAPDPETGCRRLGGFVEHEHNLSHLGGCWVKPGAVVLGDSRVVHNAVVDHGSLVSGNAIVGGSAHTLNCLISGNAVVAGQAKIHGVAISDPLHDINYKDDGRPYVSLEVSGNAIVCGRTKLYGSVMVHSMAFVGGCATLDGNTQLRGTSHVGGMAEVMGSVLSDNSIIAGNVNICGSSLSDEAAIVPMDMEVPDRHLRICDVDLGSSARIDGPYQVVAIHAGGMYRVTATPEHLMVGCKALTYREWIERFEHLWGEEVPLESDAGLQGSRLGDMLATVMLAVQTLSRLPDSARSWLRSGVIRDHREHIPAAKERLKNEEFLAAMNYFDLS